MSERLGDNETLVGLGTGEAHPHRIAVNLRPDQHRRVTQLLISRRERHPHATHSDVIRDLLDLGLHRMGRGNR